MKEVIKYTKDFFTYCGEVGMVISDDGVAIREYLCCWQNDENINQEIVDNVFSHLTKIVSLNFNLDDLYDWYHDFKRPIPDEAEFRKFWRINKRNYDIAMKYFGEKDLERKQYEMNERMEKMNSDF